MRSWSRGRPAASISLVCGACTLLVGGLWFTNFEPLRSLEFQARDFLIRNGRGEKVDSQLVYLAIDYSSVALELPPETIAASPALTTMQEAGWPWRRDVYALILDRLIEAEREWSVSIFFFPTPREGDDAFAAALARHREQVVIGSNFVDAPTGLGGSFTLPAPTLIPLGDPPDDRVGFVNFWPDEGDVEEKVRRVCYATTINEIAGLPPPPGETVYRSFAAQLLNKAGFAEKVPVTSARHVFRYADRHDSAIHPRSIYQIFVPEIWARPPWRAGEFLRDKIVVVGPHGNWSKDEIQTPFGLMPGPELHLNAINAALRNSFLKEASPRVNLTLILAAGVLASLLNYFIGRPLLRVALLSGVAALIFATAWLLYDLARFQIAISSPLLALATSGGVWLVWDLVIHRRERMRTRRTLERYMSRNLVQEILDNPATYFNSLGGVRRCVAILFTDLRGFTTMTEEADSQQLVSQLNEYFTAMVKPIFAHNGTVDKFIGDAIMAIWGNVVSEGSERDVTLALTAALRMKRSLAELNQGWVERGLAPWSMGFGLDYGEAIVGNIGATGDIEKMDLTVIGDTINLASRLEGLTKEYGVDLLIGETAAQHIAGRFHIQLVDLVRVKGKNRPLRIYTVLGEASDPLEPDHERYLAAFNEAMAAYHAGRFQEAGELFAASRKIRAEDPIAAIFIERCARLTLSPPGPAWNGVFVMTKK